MASDTKIKQDIRRSYIITYKRQPNKTVESIIDLAVPRVKAGEGWRWCPGNPQIQFTCNMEVPQEESTKQNPRDCEELDIVDGKNWIEIDELISILKQVKTRYGTKSKVQFDAGHNNIMVSVIPTKERK